MRLTFLGTGTSHGVPVIGCSCPTCASRDPRDARYRSSVLVESGGAAAVVDAGPEFRLQALRARVGAPGGPARIDALLLTHAHSDHVNGLDDVRPLTRERVLPVYGNRATLDETAQRFAYVFRDTQEGGGKPRIELREAQPEGVEIGAAGGELLAVPVPVTHGSLGILGWRFGQLAYLTDASSIPEASFALLEGVRVLVVDGLRMKPHATHFSFGQAIEAARRIGARRTWITHICHESSHAQIEEYCGREGADVGAGPAWDGLSIEL
jgi:phosphoribosyl 1,2-cyclic phosphate phosphodiesterase